MSVDMRTALHCCLMVAALAAVARSAVTSRLSPDSLTRLRRLSHGPEPNLPAPAAAERQIETVVRKRSTSPQARNLDTYGKPLNPDDFHNAKKLKLKAQKRKIVDPTENANLHLYQGDIIDVKTNEPTARNGIMIQEQRWPGAEIPYVISSGFTTQERSMIARAVSEFEKNTCIRVVPLPPGVDSTHGHVHIVKGNGCYSSVGRNSKGKSQQLSLGYGCMALGIIVHEFMHAAGFWHEQSRPDRDEHVKIHWNNINGKTRYNFKKMSWSEVQSLGEPYDLGSIMHYGPYAFALNRRKPTITALKPTKAEMGQRNGLSRVDINKLKKLYECDVKKPMSPPKVLPPACKDKNTLCAKWVQKGKCTKNAPYMHRQCPHSCNTCPGKICVDHDKQCAKWAQSGECKTSAYMNLYCRQSCKLCNKPSSTLCKDNYKLCPAWAQKRECDKTPIFMHGYCRKSCKIC